MSTTMIEAALFISIYATGLALYALAATMSNRRQDRTYAREAALEAPYPVR